MTLSARTGRLVVTEVAAAGVLSGAAHGPAALTASALAGTLLTAAAWARWRGRRLTTWAGIALRHRRSRPPTAPTRFATIDDQTTAIDDEHGLTALLDVGDPEAVLPGAQPPIPHPAGLRPQDPAVRIQFLLVTAPSDGGLPARRRALLVVRVPHEPGRETADRLTAALRRVRDRLDARDVPHHTLDGPRIRAAVADAALAAEPPRQAWDRLESPGLTQVTFRLRDPEEGREGPAAARALSITANGAWLRIATSPPGGPGADDHHGLRADGEHLTGLTATLPLAREPERNDRAHPGYGEITPPAAGILLGRNRQGEPVLVQPFRPVPTELVLIGDLWPAHLLIGRALTAGATVVIDTDRPAAWAEALHAGAITAADRPGTFLRPVLEVQDRDHRPPQAPWHTTLRLLDDLTDRTAAEAARADLLLIQRLTREGATAAAHRLRLGPAAGWLTSVRPNLLALVADRTLRWVETAPQPAPVEP